MARQMYIGYLLFYVAFNMVFASMIALTSITPGEDIRMVAGVNESATSLIAESGETATDRLINTPKYVMQNPFIVIVWTILSLGAVLSLFMLIHPFGG